MDTSFQSFISNYRKNGFQHSHGDVHKQTLHALMTGNRAYFEEQKLEEMIATQAGKLADDPIQQLRDLVVCQCAVASHVAIMCDVDSELALSLSDYYIQRSKQITEPGELIDIIRKSSMHFCDIIANRNTENYSKTVRRILHYIFDHLYSPIYVQGIAADLKMNPSYLSTRFKEETGHTIKEYVHIAKLREAKNLLLYTNYSITEVAVSLGYSDLSHFTNTCKKYLGISPRQLKNMDIVL